MRVYFISDLSSANLHRRLNLHSKNHFLLVQGGSECRVLGSTVPPSATEHPSKSTIPSQSPPSKLPTAAASSELSSGVNNQKTTVAIGNSKKSNTNPGLAQRHFFKFFMVKKLQKNPKRLHGGGLCCFRHLSLFRALRPSSKTSVSFGWSVFCEKAKKRLRLRPHLYQ